jgi:hypothetical protein
MLISEELLSAYAEGYDQLTKKIAGISAEKLSEIPDYEDAWSIREHVIHLVDSETNAFIRLKSIIAQPASECFVTDEELWTKNLRSKKCENIAYYLELFGILRKICLDFISDTDIDTWKDAYFCRTYHGKKSEVTIEQWLKAYTKHVQFHLEFIDKILNS